MSTSVTLPVPEKIGKYTIESILGRGGMGVVYRARDERMDRVVALKTLTPDLADDASMLARFYREAERAGKLNHPNIVTIFDLGEHNGLPFIVMEFLIGETLESLIEGGRNLPLVHRLKIVFEVCEALAHAHERRVIHRDVKPLNVILMKNGSAKLLDFGLAVQENTPRDLSLTATGSIIGTTAYMAPERLSDAVVDGRSDIFAAGVVMFRLLTGVLPFRGADHSEVAKKILYEPHPALQDFVPGYPGELSVIIDRALQKDPSLRYQTADQMASEIAAAMEPALQQHVQDLIASAQQLGQASALTGASEKLEELLRWNPKHTQARKMLAALKQRLSEQERQHLVEEKRKQAEQALYEKRPDVALALLEEASSLAPDNAALTALLAEVRQKQQVLSRISELCTGAEAARSRGDLTSARAMYESAIHLDTHNSRLRIAYGKLLQDVTHAENQAKADVLLQDANAHLQRRDFKQALTLLELAARLDPTSSQVHAATASAQDGLRAEERRQILEDLEARIATAITEEELGNVAELVRTRLERTPGDASLLRLRLELDQRLQLHRDRRAVSDAAESCRRLLLADDLSGAHRCVSEALAKVPGNPHLLDLLERIDDRQRLEAQRNQRQGAVVQANDALKRSDYAAAVSILTNCLRESHSKEVADLLEIAKHQAALDARRQAFAECHRRAQQAMRQENYADVVAIIQPMLREEKDERLQQMLEKAQWAEADLSRERGAGLSTLQNFAANGLHEQVMAFAATLSARVKAMPEILALLEGTGQAETKERASLRAIGKSYGELITDDPRMDWKLDSTGAKGEAVSTLQTLLAGRRECVADAVLSEQLALLREDKKKAGEATVDTDRLQRAKDFAPFASKDIADQWAALSSPLFAGVSQKIRERLRGTRYLNS